MNWWSLRFISQALSEETPHWERTCWEEVKEKEYWSGCWARVGGRQGGCWRHTSTRNGSGFPPRRIDLKIFYASNNCWNFVPYCAICQNVKIYFHKVFVESFVVELIYYTYVKGWKSLPHLNLREGTKKNFADKKRLFFGKFLPNMGGWGHSFPNENHNFWTNENSPFVLPNLTKTLAWVGG